VARVSLTAFDGNSSTFAASREIATPAKLAERRVRLGLPL
jgi:hypothetical protein